MTFLQLLNNSYFMKYERQIINLFNIAKNYSASAIYNKSLILLASNNKHAKL